MATYNTFCWARTRDILDDGARGASIVAAQELRLPNYARKSGASLMDGSRSLRVVSRGRLGSLFQVHRSLSSGISKPQFWM
eukprot:9091352-Pyramimonas_sp.AAC.1